MNSTAGGSTAWPGRRTASACPTGSSPTCTDALPHAPEQEDPSEPPFVALTGPVSLRFLC
jgi:hypothetical protein